MKNINIITLTIVLCIVTFNKVAGETLPPYEDNTSRQEVSFRNFKVTLFTENRDQEIYTYNGETKVYPPEASVHVDVEAVQSEVRGYCVPFGQDMDIRSYRDQTITVSSYFNYLFCDEEHEWTEPGTTSSSIHYGDFNLHANLETEHGGQWENIGDDVWEFFPNNDVNSNLYANIELTEVTYASVSVADYFVSHEENVWDGITVHTNAEFNWIGDPNLFREFFPTEDEPPHSGGGGGGGSILAEYAKVVPVPEPSTTTLLLMATITCSSLLRRKRKESASHE